MTMGPLYREVRHLVDRGRHVADSHKVYYGIFIGDVTLYNPNREV
jgi:hypothetical protein